MRYADFLQAKAATTHPDGRDVTTLDVHPILHDWQARTVVWAAQVGRAALFEDCGMGKTFQQVEWARLMSERSLIVAPLSVAEQTIAEAAKLDVTVDYVREPTPGPGLHITNYEMAAKVDLRSYGAVVLDESSILKNVDGKTRRLLTEQCDDVPYRLACTATPAPNDVAEIVNHATWLGHMERPEMLAAFFINDQDVGWRLKGHAREGLLDFLSQWAVAARSPSDLGGDDTGYLLPDLTIREQRVAVEIEAPGQLFPTDLGGVGGRARVRRETLDARVERAAELLDHDRQAIAWCALNDESSDISKAVDGAVEVTGTDPAEDKVAKLRAFINGDARVLVTKPKIAGFGMNFQNAAHMTFVGLGDSYETYYQAVRRCWRYGQTSEVVADIVVSDLESQIVANVNRKARQAGWLVDELSARNRIGAAA